MSEGKIKIKLKNQFFSRVGTLFVMSEDSLTIEYNERALNKRKESSRRKKQGKTMDRCCFRKI